MEFAAGCRVRVLPGRRFPAFGSGDTGEVRRVDEEAKTCDVVFDGSARGSSAAPVQVAMRYLKVIEEDRPAVEPVAVVGFSSIDVRAEEASTAGYHAGGSSSSASRPASRPTTPMRSDHQAVMQMNSTATEGWSTAVEASEELLSRMVVLEVKSSSQQRALSNLEVRLASCEAALTIAGAEGVAEVASHHTNASGRLVAARVAALEGAHQAEIAELRRALDESLAISREQEQLFRRHRSSSREAEHVFEETEVRILSLRDGARTLREELDRLNLDLESQERRAVGLGELVGAETVGMARIDSLMEGKQKRARELDEALSSAHASADSLHSFVEEQIQHISGLESRLQALRATEDLEGSANRMQAPDNEPIWQALRELQELVVHESEHRAAGLREVLAVLGQGVEQLRTEQARHVSDMEERSRSEQRRAKQHVELCQARHADFEKKIETMDGRVVDLFKAFGAERNARAQAVALLDEQARIAPASARGSSPVRTQTASTSPEAFCRTDIVTSASMQRLEALEAKHDKGSSGGLRSTEGTLGKLRDRLAGLRTDFAPPTGSADMPCFGEAPPRPAQTQVARCSSVPSITRAAAMQAAPILRPLAGPTAPIPTAALQLTGPVVASLQPTAYILSPCASPSPRLVTTATSEVVQAPLEYDGKYTAPTWVEPVATGVKVMSQAQQYQPAQVEPVATGVKVMSQPQQYQPAQAWATQPLGGVVQSTVPQSSSSLAKPAAVSPPTFSSMPSSLPTSCVASG